MMKARQAAAKKKLESKKSGSAAAAAAAAEAKARAAVAQLGQTALPSGHPPVQRPARLHRAAFRAGEERPRLSAAEKRSRSLTAPCLPHSPIPTASIGRLQEGGEKKKKVKNNYQTGPKQAGVKQRGSDAKYQGE